jgi:hypothetical protein
MDRQTFQPPITSNNSNNSNIIPTNDIFNNKNFIIILLLVLLILSFLGINLLAIFGNFIQTIVSIFGPLVTQILSIFGYTAGTLIDKSAEIVTDTAKTGIDIAGGTVGSIGDLIKDASRPGVDERAKQQLDNSINFSKPSTYLQIKQPEPDSTTNPIQKPITSNKAGWCLVGEYEGRRGCIQVGQEDKCLSGQVYPNQKMCLNPTLTTNA